MSLRFNGSFVLGTIVLRMPDENYEKVFATSMTWSRFPELSTYDETTYPIELGNAVDTSR
jgi:hypothetical protein